MRSGTMIEVSEIGSLRIEGNLLILSYQNRIHKFKLSKGMRHLAALLSHREIPFQPEQLELYEHQTLLERSVKVTSEERIEHGFTLSSDFPAYELADLATVKEVKKRLIQIIAEIAEAESWNDYSRRDDLESEQEKLLAYLKEVYRPGGKPRCFPSEDKLQRKRVLKSLSRALAEIKAAEPELALHLTNSLKLADYFVYRPQGPALEVTGS